MLSSSNQFRFGAFDTIPLNSNTIFNLPKLGQFLQFKREISKIILIRETLLTLICLSDLSEAGMESIVPAVLDCGLPQMFPIFEFQFFTNI